MIEIEKVRKSYNSTRALDGFSLKVEDGELYGLVGPNGAGKTTLIKILSTLLKPDTGGVRLAGMDVTVRAAEVKRVVGYMPDQPGLYQDMRVREVLEFFAGAFQLPKERGRKAVEQCLERSGLASRSEAFVEELSFGMKQKLFLAKTLLHEPKVLLLDEPATGLDPLARVELRNTLKELNAQGITILISSHILADLEDLCTRVALIGEGTNAADREGHTIIDLQKARKAKAHYEVEVLGDAEPAARRAAEIAGVGVIAVSPTYFVLEITGEPAQASRVLKELVAVGIEVVRFAPSVASLEERYRQAFGGMR